MNILKYTILEDILFYYFPQQKMLPKFESNVIHDLENNWSREIEGRVSTDGRARALVQRCSTPV